MYFLCLLFSFTFLLMFYLLDNCSDFVSIARSKVKNCSTDVILQPVFDRSHRTLFYFLGWPKQRSRWHLFSFRRISKKRLFFFVSVFLHERQRREGRAKSSSCRTFSVPSCCFLFVSSLMIDSKYSSSLFYCLLVCSSLPPRGGYQRELDGKLEFIFLSSVSLSSLCFVFLLRRESDFSLSLRSLRPPQFDN